MILDPGAMNVIYGPSELEDLRGMVNFQVPAQTKHSILRQRELLAEAEVIFTGWGAPVMDETFLAAAPKLRAVFSRGGQHPLVYDARFLAAGYRCHLRGGCQRGFSRPGTSQRTRSSKSVECWLPKIRVRLNKKASAFPTLNGHFTLPDSSLKIELTN
jgi:hypothetical protein